MRAPHLVSRRTETARRVDYKLQITIEVANAREIIHLYCKLTFCFITTPLSIQGRGERGYTFGRLEPAPSLIRFLCQTA